MSFPTERSTKPLDGRVILMLSRDFTREPRTHVLPNEPLASPYLFGLTVDGLVPGGTVVMDGSAFGWPATHLSSVPSGDYYVQAVLNRYEEFHLADGRTLKLPPDKGEGQQWSRKPGNLYSKPVSVHIDPDHPVRTALVLDQEMPAVTPPKDTEFVRHIRIRSELLSKFWGRDVYLGAHVLLPKGFDAHPQARYPLMVFHGHFPDDISEFRTAPPDSALKPEYSNRFQLAGYNIIEQQEAYEDKNAYTLKGEASAVERPAFRNYLGEVFATQRDENYMELAQGDRSRSGGQYDIWQAVFSPVGPEGYPQPIFDKVSGAIDPAVASYWREHYDLSYIIQRDWTTLAPKLKGKIHLYVGTGDNYFLTDSVYFTQERLESLQPKYEGSVAYGERAEHCWNGDPTLPNAYSRLHYDYQYLPVILRRIAASAPRGADLKSWRY